MPSEGPTGSPPWWRYVRTQVRPMWYGIFFVIYLEYFLEYFCILNIDLYSYWVRNLIIWRLLTFLEYNCLSVCLSICMSLSLHHSLSLSLSLILYLWFSLLFYYLLAYPEAAVFIINSHIYEFIHHILVCCIFFYFIHHNVWTLFTIW